MVSNYDVHSPPVYSSVKKWIIFLARITQEIIHYHHLTSAAASGFVYVERETATFILFLSPPLSGRDIYRFTHFRNSEIKQLSPLYFAMLWDIDLIFGMWVHSDKFTDQVCVSFRSNDFWPSYGPWTLKFGQIFSCHHFFRYAWRYWLDFLHESV